METMIISEFKARAIATLKRVKESGSPILITIRGQPVARIVPPIEPSKKRIALGTGRGLIRKRPDDRTLAAMDFAEEWEMGA